MKNYLLGSLLTIGLSFSIFSEVKAATISLNFDSLPNQQGWIRESNSSRSAFSVDGTKLIQIYILMILLLEISIHLVLDVQKP